MKLSMPPLWPEIKKLQKAFRFGYDSDKILYHEGAKFSPLAMICTFSMILLLRSLLLKNIETGSLLIAIIILLADLFYKIKISTHRFHLKRQFAKSGREQTSTDVTYHLFSPDGKKGINLHLIDEFSGQKNISLNIRASLAQNFLKKTIKVELNNGMGIHSFGPLELKFNDLLGIMQVNAKLDHPQKMIVYPKIERMRPKSLRPDLHSFHSGPLDVTKRGDSQIFRGVREYRYGDSYKHINWKKTAQFGTLYTNEYEKSVNANIKIVLDLDKTLHFGSGHHSTWEILKDYAMALASQQMHTSNSVSGITQKGIIGPGRGQTFINQLEMMLPRLGLVDSEKIPFLSKASPLLVAGDALFYLTPFLHSKIFYQNLQVLSHLSFRLENRPTLILVDALRLLWNEGLGTDHLAMKALSEISSKGLKELLVIKGKYPFDILTLTIPTDQDFSFMSIKNEVGHGK